jgi:hypothetical protein
LKAYQLDPTNPVVINNLQLLNSSYATFNARHKRNEERATALVLERQTDILFRQRRLGVL